jgi:hypothetical protein
MYCNQTGTVDVICKDGSRMTLTNVLYIPGLGVNLLSGKEYARQGLLVNLLNHICTLKRKK